MTFGAHNDPLSRATGVDPAKKELRYHPVQLEDDHHQLLGIWTCSLHIYAALRERLVKTKNLMSIQ